MSRKVLCDNLLAQNTRVHTCDSAAIRLVATDVDDVVSSFEYNGLGQRASQPVDGVTTEYVLDVTGGLPEVIVATSGGPSTYYLQVQGQVLGQYGSGAWAYCRTRWSSESTIWQAQPRSASSYNIIAFS